MGRRRTVRTGDVLAADLGRYVEEHKLTGAVEPLMGRPVIVAELLTSDHRLIGVVLTPTRAHKLSDDLLRAAAGAMRQASPEEAAKAPAE